MTPESDESENSEDKKSFQGIDFFPERRGDQMEKSWFRKLFFGENRDNLQRVRCERNIHNVVSESMLHSPVLIQVVHACNSVEQFFIENNL